MIEIENAEQFALRARQVIAEAQAQLPDDHSTNLFDAERVLAFDPLLYGPLGDGPMIGKWIRFTGGSVKNYVGFEVASPDICGVVIGDFHGRVLLSCEAFDGVMFLGWLKPTEYEIIQVTETGVQKWLK